MCGSAVFVIAVLGPLIVRRRLSSSTPSPPSRARTDASPRSQCPTEHVFNTQELNDRSYTQNPDKMLVAIRGEVFDLTSFAPHHQPGSSVIPTVRLLSSSSPAPLGVLC